MKKDLLNKCYRNGNYFFAQSTVSFIKKNAFCFFLIALIFVVNGSAQRKTKRPTKKVTKINTNIRKIDFRNFKYNTSEDLCIENLILRKGRQKYGDSDMDWAELSSVKYVDFDGDGKEEAFVVIEYTTSGSSGGGINAFVFAYRNGSAQQIWSKCNERSGTVLKGRLILFTYPEYVGNDAHCCPSYNTTDTYGWKGTGISRISKKRKASGYE